MREQTVLVPSSLKKNLTGPMETVAVFSKQPCNQLDETAHISTAISGRTYLAVATTTGVYVAFREDPSVFTRVLQLPKITILTALPRYDRLILLVNGTLLSYSLQALVTVAQNRAPPAELDKTLVKLAPKHSGQVHFFRVGKISGRDLRKFSSRLTFLREKG